MPIATGSDPLAVLVIGCGNIAGGFDAARAPDAAPCTHAGAFRRHGRYRLSACVDPDETRRREFMRHWGVASGYSSMDALVESGSRFDVVSICSPTDCHASDVLAALRLEPRIIFCEKPVTPNAATTAELVQSCEAAGVPLVINHTRRWDPEITRIRGELASGVWGAVRTVVGLYNKGVLNNGSHMIDLLHHLLGPVSVVATGTPVWDGLPDDPSVPAILSGVKTIPIHLVCGHASDFALFELQIVTERGVLTMEEGGVAWRIRRTNESPHFRGYRTLDAGERHAGGYLLAMLGAVSNIHEALSSGAELASTGRSALAVQEICERIKEKSGLVR
ncbi:MAG: Gfo/Idh/MocA family oxidoreductase [Nitrospirota bacterium]|nr:Gfo/Idh/MocA family oxidoreductase [Nitrospirota bacterium]MDP3515163.1 Gfo/Idh/MocA family oxidoreductase [Sulfuritalea sp.]